MIVLQWNLNGFYSRLENLQYLCKLHSPDIICVQETNFKGKSHGKITGYTCTFKNRSNPEYACGGVAIYSKKSIPIEILKIQTDMEFVAIKINSTNPICIGNIYIPNRYPLQEIEMHDIINQIKEPFIILGDFNCHHSLWGSYKIDKRGRLLEKVIDDHDSIILNSGDPTHINISNNRLSAIDLSIASPTIAQKCTWNVMDFPYDSDHFPILIDIHEPSVSISHEWRNPIPNYKNINWLDYQKKIDEHLNEEYIFKDDNNIDQIVESFCNIISNSANSMTQMHHGPFKFKSVPWWNSECKVAITNAKKAFNRYKKRRDNDSRINYKRTRAIARRTVKINKARSWTEYISSINCQSNSTESWKKIKSIRGMKTNSTIHFLRCNDQIIRDPKIIAEEFAETFMKNSSTSNYHTEFITYKEKAESEPNMTPIDDSIYDNDMNSPIFMHELQQVLKKINNSAPGPDKIPNCLIKNLPKRGINILLKYITIYG